jgi:hypothetical protein
MVYDLLISDLSGLSAWFENRLICRFIVGNLGQLIHAHVGESFNGGTKALKVGLGKCVVPRGSLGLESQIIIRLGLVERESVAELHKKIDIETEFVSFDHVVGNRWNRTLQKRKIFVAEDRPSVSVQMILIGEIENLAQMQNVNAWALGRAQHQRFKDLPLVCIKRNCHGTPVLPGTECAYKVTLLPKFRN